MVVAVHIVAMIVSSMMVINYHNSWSCSPFVTRHVMHHHHVHHHHRAHHHSCHHHTSTAHALSWWWVVVAIAILHVWIRVLIHRVSCDCSRALSLTGYYNWVSVCVEHLWHCRCDTLRSCHSWLALWISHSWLNLWLVRVHHRIHWLLTRLLTVHLRLLTILLRLLTILWRHECILLSHHLIHLSLLLLHLKLLFLPFSKGLLSRRFHWNHNVKHLNKITSVLVRSVANTDSGHIRLK